MQINPRSLKTCLKAALLLAFVTLAMLAVVDGHKAGVTHTAPLMLSQASMLLPALG